MCVRVLTCGPALSQACPSVLDVAEVAQGTRRPAAKLSGLLVSSQGKRSWADAQRGAL